MSSFNSFITLWILKFM